VAAREAVARGVPVADIEKMGVRENIARAKYIPEDKMEQIKGIKEEIDKEMEALVGAQAA
jgi:V/A-type H+-transporting ATPase subunit A